MNNKKTKITITIIAPLFIFFTVFLVSAFYEKYNFSKDISYLYTNLNSKVDHKIKHKFKNINAKYLFKLSQIDDLIKNKQYSEAIHECKTILNNKSINYNIKISTSIKLAQLYLSNNANVSLETFESVLNPLLKNKFFTWHYHELMLYYKYKNKIDYQKEFDYMKNIATDSNVPEIAKDRLSKLFYVLEIKKANNDKK